MISPAFIHGYNTNGEQISLPSNINFEGALDD